MWLGGLMNGVGSEVSNKSVRVSGVAFVKANRRRVFGDSMLATAIVLSRLLENTVRLQPSQRIEGVPSPVTVL
jgi:hypothetical protein